MIRFAVVFSFLFSLSIVLNNAYQLEKYTCNRKFNIKRCQTRVYGLKEDLILIANKRSTPTSLAAFVYSQYGLLGLCCLSQVLKTDEGDPLLQSAVDAKLSEAFKASSKSVTVALSNSQYNFVINNPLELKFNTNGRSTIVDCLRYQREVSTSSLPVFDKSYYKMKLISDLNRYDRDIAAMKRLTNSNNLAKSNSQEFNQIIFHAPNILRIGSNGLPLSVIVMTAGEMDLKTFISKYRTSIFTNKGIVKRILLDMTKIVLQIHNKGLVWTDLKVDNFIIAAASSSTLKQRQLEAYLTNKPIPTDQQLVEQSFTVKAIDLESTVVNGQPANDLSAENLSPEIVSLIANDNSIVQRGKNDFFLDINEPIIASKAGDIWALGIAFLHVITGKAPLAENGGNIKTAIQKVERYTQSNADGSMLGINNVENVRLRRLIAEMLQVDPKKRTNILSILLKLSLFI